MIERLLTNAYVYTGNPPAFHKAALAISGERIVAIGKDDDLLPLANAHTRVDNLNGRYVLPGFVDAHIHWEQTAKAQYAVDLWQVPSLAEALRRIEAKAQTLPADTWLTGSGWAQDLWTDNNRQFPTKQPLDVITGSRPAYFVGKSVHVAWANSAALNLAGIDATTPDPPGGKIFRDADGNPNGILFETPAMQLVARHIPPPSPHQLADWMAEAQSQAWACGLVGLHDFDDPSAMGALQILREQGRLGLRVVKQINLPWIESAHTLGIRTGFGDHWLRIGGLKIFADGALGARTALMIEGYADEPDNLGVVVTDKETMFDAVSRASHLGLPSTIHAIGDKAVHDVLDVFAAVRQQEAAAGVPRQARRHRLEHVQVIHPDDISRLGQLDIIASMQPIHASSDWQMADRAWGSRARSSYNWNAQLSAGARLLFGSDSPVDPFDPRLGLYCAITRQDVQGEPAGGWYPEARISLADAIRAYTVEAAYAAGMESEAGQLQVGYLADLIVMDTDIFAAEPEAIKAMPILGTMVGGEWKHRVFD